MKVTLDLNGTELMLLYINTGNESVRNVIMECIASEREFNASQRIFAQQLVKPRKSSKT